MDQKDQKLERKQAEAILSQFPHKRVLVVGDFYVDEYITGQTEKFSPEAPVPRVIIKERTYTPGCAGNVACNLRSLGAQVAVLGVLGDDQYAKILLQQFQEKGIDTKSMLIKKERVTGTFSRLLLQGQGNVKQHVVRLDTENTFTINQEIITELKQYIAQAIPLVDIIFVADYDEADGKGIVKKEILDYLVQKAKQHKKFTIGISRENIKDFAQVDLVICNEKEAEIATGKKIRNDDELVRLGSELRKQLNNKITIISRGKEGIHVFTEQDSEQESEKKSFHLPSYAKKIADVCGAGDTLTTAFALAINSGATPRQGAEIASHAAAVSIAKPGTATVTTGEILEAMFQHHKPRAHEKIKTWDELKVIIQEHHQKNKKTVFTNGYFDIIHSGHIQFLQEAKKVGGEDALFIVALNTDRSVKENKGPGNPILSQDDRAKVMAALECVDYVTFFDELSPIRMLKELKPSILVKGGNFDPEHIVGKDVVTSYRGEVKVIPLVQSQSGERLEKMIHIQKMTITKTRILDPT